MKKNTYFNRELSWLSFNERVIQEAEDEQVPLIERLRFLGIYSNNLDEFYRVRVATLTRLIHLGDKAISLIGNDPITLLNEISNIELRLRKKYNNAYAGILKGLEKENILIINEKKLNDKQISFVKKYFREKVRPTLGPIMLDKKILFLGC